MAQACDVLPGRRTLKCAVPVPNWMFRDKGGAIEKVGLNGYRISITRVAGAAYAVICGFQVYRAHQ